MRCDDVTGHYAGAPLKPIPVPFSNILVRAGHRCASAQVKADASRRCASFKSLTGYTQGHSFSFFFFFVTSRLLWSLKKKISFAINLTVSKSISRQI